MNKYTCTFVTNTNLFKYFELQEIASHSFIMVYLPYEKYWFALWIPWTLAYFISFSGISVITTTHFIKKALKYGDTIIFRMIKTSFPMCLYL